MTRYNQKVQYNLDSDNYGRYLGQTIADIVVDEENYAFGYWKGKLVASFHIDNGEWFVI